MKREWERGEGEGERERGREGGGGEGEREEKILKLRRCKTISKLTKFKTHHFDSYFAIFIRHKTHAPAHTQ